ncbi:MAG: thioredoxin family protein [Verrucomicrobiales bacterium]|nr:thioredoxin family protein [Verrucomicrobiales bacterium]
MKKWMLSLAACAVAFQINAAESGKGSDLEWLTDLPQAQAKAKKENKLLLLDFTGSDWCGWCIKLNKEVFSKPEFAEYAKKNLVLVEVDFPQRKKLSAAQAKANNALQTKYDVEGYPTLVILDAEGKLVGKTGYVPGGPKPFLAELAKITKKS